MLRFIYMQRTFEFLFDAEYLQFISSLSKIYIFQIESFFCRLRRTNFEGQLVKFYFGLFHDFKRILEIFTCFSHNRCEGLQADTYFI